MSNHNILNYTETINNLEKLQYDGINYIYDLEPLQKNFFYLDAFYDPYDEGSQSQSTKLKYRIQSFNTDLSLLKFTSDSSSIKAHLMSPNIDNDKQVTIKWIEDAYSSIQRYHLNWSNHWYNKELDCMVCGQKGKFRNMRIITFHYINVNTNGYSPIFKPVPISQMTFCGLFPPEQIAKIDYDYSSDTKSEVSYTYHYNKLELFYFPFYSKEEKEFIGEFTSSITDGSVMKGIQAADCESLTTKLFNTGIGKDAKGDFITTKSTYKL